MESLTESTELPSRLKSSIGMWESPLSKYFCKDTTYFSFFGNRDSFDNLSQELMPRDRNHHIFVFADANWGHNIAANLKELKLLQPLIESCFQRLTPLEIISLHFSTLAVSFSTLH